MIVTLDDLSIALDKAPLGVLVIKNGRIAWLNEILTSLAKSPKGELVGRQVQETPLATLAVEETVEIPADDGMRLLRRQHVHPLEGGEVHYFLDVTEQLELKKATESLHQRIHALETTDSVTGLQNRRAILQELDRQISRSRRYQNPLAVIRLSLDTEADDETRRSLLRTISQTLKDKLRWADEIGMLDDHTFLLVLPETSLEDARELAVKLLSDRAAFDFRDSSNRVRHGVAGWQKGDDLNKLLKRVEEDQEINLSALLS